MTHMFETETAVAIGLEPTLVLNVIKTNLNPDSTYHDLSEHWKIFTKEDWQKYLPFLCYTHVIAPIDWLTRKKLIEIYEPHISNRHSVFPICVKVTKDGYRLK